MFAMNLPDKQGEVSHTKSWILHISILRIPYTTNKQDTVLIRSVFRILDTLWLLLFMTVRHNMEIWTNCETIYIVRTCYLSLWHNGCSFHRSSRVWILQRLLFSWIKFQILMFSPKLNFFCHFKSISISNLEGQVCMQNFPQYVEGP